MSDKPWLEDLEIDIGNKGKQELVSLFDEVNTSSITVADDGYRVRINMRDPTIYAYAPRRFAFEERKQIRQITDDLLERGIIKPSISPYCARIVLVRKKNGTLRLCVDLRPLNDRVVKQKFPFPLIEDCMARLGDCEVFTLLDLKDGFHQIRVYEEDTKYLAFATPDGQFEFTRLPFGFCDAPAKFQKSVMQILQPLIREDKVIVYIDDILIPTKTVELNLEVLKEVLSILKRHGFELNYMKCQFLKKKIEYLGYTVSSEGITLSSRHTEAVRNFPQPANVHDVQKFLGLASYFRKFIKEFALIARPLYHLLKKTSVFDFDRVCKEAFETLKNCLTSYPVLRLYNSILET